MEHLLPDAAAVLHRLLQAVPGLMCITTSRQRLSIPGEHVYVVRPLDVPPATAPVTDLLNSPSVQLWLDRVKSVSPEFVLTAANAPGVALLANRLEGLPLAIELAAAWAAVLPPGDLAERLEERFGLLVNRTPTSDARHASLQAALDWSFRLLDIPTQGFLTRMGLFRGGWTLSAAEALCPDEDVPLLLARLQERSLISVEPDDAGKRYRMLETVREYAVSQLMPGEADEAKLRICTYFVSFAERCGAGLSGPDVGECIKRLNDEEENLHAALHAAMGLPADPNVLLRLSLALYRYWYIRGLVHEGRQWLSAGLAQSTDDVPERAKALMSLGNLSYGEGDLDDAQSYYIRSQALHAAARDTRGVAAALGGLGNVCLRRGDLHGAYGLMLQSSGCSSTARTRAAGHSRSAIW